MNRITAASTLPNAASEAGPDTACPPSPNPVPPTKHAGLPVFQESYPGESGNSIPDSEGTSLAERRKAQELLAQNTALGILEKDAAWHANRRLGIGGSDAGRIMSGRWLELWLQKTGRAEPEDLSGILAVQLGTHTEALNLLWFERETGRRVIARGASLTHPYYSFMRVTLDGLVEQPDAIVEAKWCGAFNKIEEIEQRYMAQCHHNMLVCGYDRAFLSVITGKPSYELIDIRRDDDYAATLLQYEEDFWRYVETDTAPPDRDGVAAPAKPTTYRSVDMSSSNAWAANAETWRENIKASRDCDKAAKELRALVEPDVGTAIGHGVKIARSKDGKLMIKEMGNV
jgi:predicted phage-related endonuclease